MKGKTNIIKKILSLLLVVLVLFSQPSTAQAIDTVDIGDIWGLGSSVSFLDEILEYFGMDQDQIKNYTENYDNKKTPPRVELHFSPTSPSEGEKITVTASPSYFLNNPKDLYYTWFLKSAYCTDKELDGSDWDYNDRCDEDDDGSVNIEDYKIKAARLIANGGFVYTNPADPNDTDFTDDLYANGTDTDGYEAPSGGNDQRGKTAYCYVHDNETGEQYEMGSCGSMDDGTRHLFPNFDADDEEVTGDGDFGRDEEEFWRTDPNSNDTANRGNVDEANVAGLGIINFTWNYQKGDKVGVVIEGVSTDIAPEPDSSYKTMWAMSNRTYSEEDDGDIDDPSDLNDLLYDALVSPSENTAGSNKLDINLSYSPTSPINDPTGINSDMLEISSQIGNAKDNNYLKYDWKIYASKEINPEEWGDTESPLLLKSDLPESTQSIGLGINTFKFKLALKDSDTSDVFSYKYLRVLLTVSEDVGEEAPRLNTQDVIIPITSNDGDQISAHTANVVSSSSNQAEVNLSLGDEICNIEATEKAICPVAKNQIIGLSIPVANFPLGTSDFLWTIDGKPFSYSYCYFDNCNEEKQINVAYFPILKEVGKKYTVNLTASATSGKKINLTKEFEVVEPNIEIVSADKNACDSIIIGKYTDVNGQQFNDYSKLNFWADTCSEIKLKTTPSGNYTWNVDGNAVNTSNASLFGFDLSTDGILTLPPKENIGESYNVTVSALYTQDNLAKKALQKIWNVSYNQFYEKIISDDAIITMQTSSSTIAEKPVKKIFASIYSSTPAYLAFLLRIVITISLILFTTKLVFSFLPEIDSEK